MKIEKEGGCLLGTNLTGTVIFYKPLLVLHTNVGLAIKCMTVRGRLSSCRIVQGNNEFLTVSLYYVHDPDRHGHCSGLVESAVVNW